MVDSRYTGVGYEPPFETPSDKDFMAAHIEALEAKLAVCQESLNDMFNVGPVCLECQQWAERWADVNNRLSALVVECEHYLMSSPDKINEHRLKATIAATKVTP